ncbi:cell division protein ZapA [Nitrospira sp. Kam-Ns4a]
MTKAVEVEIYGQRYTVKGEGDAAYIKKLAAYVNDQMQRVAKGMKSSTPAKLAVLAAINIAHQFFQAEARLREEEADIEHRAATLLASIEQQLAASRHR